jgi:Metallo-peptidase family M12B Reprolysin-like
MASVRALLDCMDINTGGSNSVLRDFFGFIRARVPTDPEPTVIAEVSMLQQAQALQGKHFHLNIIQVGFDLLADLDNALEMIDYCTYRTRNIYRTRSLGLGRVLHWEISSADADGYDNIGSQGEARDLWEDWGVDNDGIDTFVTRTRSTADDGPGLGLSPVDGDCDNGTSDDGNWGGDIATRGFDGLSRTFAHENGHYLGLEHNHGDDDCPSTTAGQNRLMAQTGCAIDVRTSVNLTVGEGNTMRGHCRVRDGC